MSTQNSNNRLDRKTINSDTVILQTLQTIRGYKPQRQEAAIATLESAQAEMVRLQKLEIQLKAQHRETLDAVRQAEWAFHNGILEAKSAVVAQFGANSQEVQKAGLKKKSSYNRPTRQKKAE